jgi:hypothetical protein
MDTKRILIISFSNLKNDSRVKRQINYLKKQNTVITMGLADPEIEDVKFIDISFKLNKIHLLYTMFLSTIGLFEKAYWNQDQLKIAKKRIKSSNLENIDLIIANDIDSVPLAISIKSRNTKIIFDAHEYSPLEHNDNLIWRIVFKKYKTYLIRKYAHLCDSMLTVCDGIVEEYKKVFQLQPIVITNACKFYDLKPSKTQDKIKMIHHGLSLPTRKIENMILMMDEVDERFELHLMLMQNNKSYYNKLEALIASRNNVFLVPCVPTDEIVLFTNKYDIGLYILEPTNFNNANALPNKFFEFIQSRLAIAIGPSPEMAKIIEKTKNGIVAEDFTPKRMAEKLNLLTYENIDLMKEKSNLLAQSLNADENMKSLKIEIDKLMSVN